MSQSLVDFGEAVIPGFFSWTIRPCITCIIKKKGGQILDAPRTEKGFLSAEFSYSPSVKITRMNWMNINKHMNHYEPMVHNCLALV